RVGHHRRCWEPFRRRRPNPSCRRDTVLNVEPHAADSIGDVLEALRRAQHLGLLGARPVEEVVEHARAFVRALATLGATARTTDGTHPSSSATPTVLDIGSGGGIPGLVVASDRPDLAVTLV